MSINRTAETHNQAVNRTQNTTQLFVHSLRSLSHKKPLRISRQLQRRYETMRESIEVKCLAKEQVSRH